MDSEFLQGFLAQAEGCLPIIRHGILVAARSGNLFGELNNSLRQTTSVKNAASIVRLDEAARAAENLEEKLKVFAALKTTLTEEQSGGLLENLGELERALAQVTIENAGDFFADYADYADEDDWTEEFEADAETLKIFAEEAETIVAKICANLETLEKTPKSRAALLEIRRGAHSLKGSAGVVGLKMLADIAHRVEDLLDYLADSGTPVGTVFFEILCVAADCFGLLASGENSAHLAKKINRLYEHFDALAATLPLGKTVESPTAKFIERMAENQGAPHSAAENFAPRSIVRVALEKLDDLQEIVNRLSDSQNEFRAALQRQLAATNRAESGDWRGNLETLYENQNRLVEALRERLPRLRMIRFGSLAVRLQRAVRVAADETEKSAELIIENEFLEVDTQTLDSLTEPLMQMLRNAVAHGIEPPDVRRALGKPEAGNIVIRLANEKTHFVLTVADDGRGISAAELKAKALQNGVIGETEARTMGEREIYELIFHPGLTTAEAVSQVSGRGVGMDIVKIAVERQQGAISIESEINRGTTFTVRLPLPTTNAFSVKAGRRQSEKRSVMIVDDSLSVRQHVSNVVETAGWTATAASDGLEALDILQASSDLPDVILSDIEMPCINGSELLAILKERENFREIPVVMVTSRTDLESRREAFAAGAAEYLTKPFDDARLIETIKTLTA